jgi:hypothetical protein
MFFDDFFDDFDWQDIGLAGALAEEMSEDEKERRRLERETDIPDPLDEEEESPEEPDYEDFIP